MNWLKTKLSSKKVRATIAGIVLVIANDALDLHLNPETVASVVGLLASYVIGQGIADKGKDAAKVQAELAPKIEAMPGFAGAFSYPIAPGVSYTMGSDSGAQPGGDLGVESMS